MTDSLIAVPGMEKTSNVFRQKLIAIAEPLGINPDYLATVISFETGHTFDPAQPNLGRSGATGLIQFYPNTSQRARDLGCWGSFVFSDGTCVSMSQLAAMTAENQLDYVAKYFAPWRGRLRTLDDTYLAVFFPGAIGKSSDFVIGEKGSSERIFGLSKGDLYAKNCGFDRGGCKGQGKGYYTVSDVTSHIRALYNTSAPLPRVPVINGGGYVTKPTGTGGAGFFLVLAAAGGAYLAMSKKSGGLRRARA